MFPHDSQEFPDVVWPELTSSYVDEFGPLDADVYAAAGKLWPSLIPRIKLTIKDVQDGQTVMIKAVALVSRMKREHPERITHVQGYLRTTFNHLLFEELKKKNKHGELNLESVELISRQAAGPNERIYQGILIDEVLARADPNTRFILENMLIGYSLEEIARTKGRQSNSLRNELSRGLKRIREGIWASKGEIPKKKSSE